MNKLLFEINRNIASLQDGLKRLKEDEKAQEEIAAKLKNLMQNLGNHPYIKIRQKPHKKIIN